MPMLMSKLTAVCICLPLPCSVLFDWQYVCIFSLFTHCCLCVWLQLRANLPADQPLLVRMTGCPNGCARPYTAELGFVGDGPNRCVFKGPIVLRVNNSLSSFACCGHCHPMGAQQMCVRSSPRGPILLQFHAHISF